jgi:hypothetical protein
MVSEKLLRESSKDKITINEQSSISREQIRLRVPFDSFKAKQGVSVNTLGPGHKRSLSAAKDEKDVMYNAAISFEKQMEEIVHTFFKLDDGLKVKKLEELRTRYHKPRKCLPTTIMY